MFIYYDDKTLCHVLVFLFSNTKLHKPRKIEYSVCYELGTKAEDRTHRGPTIHRSGVLTTEILGDSWRMRSYYMEESVLLGTKPLVDSIRHSIRDPSGVFSVCHTFECHIVQ